MERKRMRKRRRKRRRRRRRRRRKRSRGRRKGEEEEVEDFRMGTRFTKMEDPDDNDYKDELMITKHKYN